MTDELSTPERIMEAAGPLFAEHGFEQTTVRMICDAASVNVASVNYHFGNKDALYLKTFQRAVHTVNERYPFPGEDEGRSDPQAGLASFVRAFLLRRFDTRRPSWCGALVARQMRHPDQQVRDIVHRQRGEVRGTVERLVSAALGPEADRALLDLCVSSVLGQVFHHFHGARRHRRSLTPEDIDRVSQHVAAFSLGGLTYVSKSPPPGHGRNDESR